jgi:F-type H+-transporting ATPase subunit gamma
MPNLKDIRNRIGTVKNTKKITSAMKLVAAAKLRRAQEAVQAARPYATKMTALIDDLSSRVPEDAHPLLVAPEKEENVLIVLVTSDRGLCGGFNSNLIRAVARFVREKRPLTDTIRMVTVGRKGNQFFKRSAVDIEADYPGLSADVTFEGAKEVAQQAMSMFTNGEVDTVYLAYNEFLSAIAVEQHIEQILPLTREEADPADGGSELEYIYEPSEAELLGTLLPNSVEIRVFQALLESAAGEQGQRMTAMDNATSNASDMIDDLTLTYNRARQAYITKELVEIVSGAESLKG